jgi:hypothetical protein
MNGLQQLSVGDQKVMVELTVNEAMALGLGLRFRPESRVETNARRKVQQAIEQKLIQSAQEG